MVLRNWTSFRHSKNQELEADSLAFIWMKNSKYKASELLNTFKMIESREVKNYRKSFNKWYKKEKLIPHATSNERLAAFKRFTQYNKSDTGDYFVIDQKYFNKVRTEAKYETLKLLDQNNNYSCLEQSFRFHLFDPDNITYVYYIMESIRDLGDSNPLLWDQNFLSYGLYDTVRIDNRVRKISITKSIFKEIDYEMLPMYEFEIDLIKSQFYWEGTPKYKTYNEAIEFYNALGKGLRCNECLLSYGESLEDKKLTNRYIKGYLNSLSVSGNMDKCLLKKIANDSMFTKHIIFIDDFVSFVKQGQEFVYLTEDKTDINKIIKDSLQAHFPQKEFYLLSEIKDRSLSEYNELITLLNPKLRYDVSDVLKNIRGENIDYGDVSQQSKNVFGKYQAKEIEYLQCEFYDSKNSNNSLDLYKDITNSDYDEILKKTKSTRTLNIWLRGISLMNNKDLNYTRYQYLDNKIKYPSSSSKCNF